jgi:hypothetical protein
MTADNFCFYLQKRLTKQVKQEVNGTVILPPLVFPGYIYKAFTSIVVVSLTLQTCNVLFNRTREFPL